jgi:tetratricopeptide (TPR) repeat protein
LTVGEEALRWARQGEESALEGSILADMGIAYSRLGLREQAHQAFCHAHQLAQRQGAKEAEATALLYWGDFYTQIGNFAQALESLQQALFLLRRIDKQAGIAMVLYHLGSLLLTIGNLGEARTHLEQALAMLHRVSERYYEEAVIIKVSALYLQLGLYEKAESYQEQALRLAAGAGYQALLAEALLNGGRLWAIRGQRRQAVDAFQRALAFWQENEQRGWACAAQCELAWLAFAEGDGAAALTAITPVVAELQRAPLDFAVDPLQIAWRCYTILAAHQDGRAQPLLVAAYQQLQQQAQSIQDDDLRQNLLTQVAHYQAISAAFQTQKR